MVDYCFACIDEYKKRYKMESRGYSILQRQEAVIDALEANEKMLYNWEYDLYKQEEYFLNIPQWLTEDFCRGHRKLLLEKDFAFYSTKFDVDREEMV